MDSSGNVILTGTIAANEDFGGGALPIVGAYDIFVAKFSPSGMHTWSKSFGCIDYDFGKGVAVDGGGNVLMTGNFKETIDFGGGPLSAPIGSSDGYLLKFAP